MRHWRPLTSGMRQMTAKASNAILILNAGDSSDEEGYQYPPYDENLVRQRRNVAGGYNLNIQDGEEGAVGGAVGGTGLLQRDIAA